MSDSFTMPIMQRNFSAVSVTWRPTAADEKRADKNHGQTLARLAERGGVNWSELAAILEDRAWVWIEPGPAQVRVHRLLVDRASTASGSSHPQSGSAK